MKSTIKSIMCTVMVLVSFHQVKAQQDPNFTLYNFNMNIINPAVAGIKESPELNLVYRSQWIGVDDAPSTTSLAYSMPLGKNLGVGLSIINDNVFVLSETDVTVDFSYKVQLSELTNVYFGLKVGAGFVDIDLTKAGAPTEDPLFSQNQNFTNPHVGSGMYIDNPKFYISFSTPNFLRGERYEKQGNAPSAAVDALHFYMGGGYHFDLSDALTLTPKVMIRTVQGAPTSYDVGAELDINKRTIAGTNYRVNEMYSFYALTTIIDKLRIGAGYDITQSEFSTANDDGSIEIILKYQF